MYYIYTRLSLISSTLVFVVLCILFYIFYFSYTFYYIFFVVYVIPILDHIVQLCCRLYLLFYSCNINSIFLVLSCSCIFCCIFCNSFLYFPFSFAMCCIMISVSFVYSIVYYVYHNNINLIISVLLNGIRSGMQPFYDHMGYFRLIFQIPILMVYLLRLTEENFVMVGFLPICKFYTQSILFMVFFIFSALSPLFRAVALEGVGDRPRPRNSQ